MVKKIIISVAVILVVVGAITGYKLYNAIYHPHVILKNKETEFFYVKTGWTFDDVANALYEKNYVQDRNIFEWLAERKNYKKKVLPGKYLLKKKMSYNEILNLLRSGKQVPVKLQTDHIHSVNELAGKAGKILEADSSAIMELLSDKSFLAKHELSSKDVFSIFFANTYDFHWNTSAEQFFLKMYSEHKKFWNEKRTNQAKQKNMTKLEIATLASIVEMESRKKDEKPIIAGVYLNRLEKDMLLQADPTVIFAVGDFSIKRVVKKHLATDSPYNTYKYKGLPPGPICIPSAVSIDAVLNSEEHNYIFFCAKEDFSGYHNFAETYAQHMVNAKRYQEALGRLNIN